MQGEIKIRQTIQAVAPTYQTDRRQTTDLATEKCVAIGEIACAASEGSQVYIIYLGYFILFFGHIFF